MWLIEWMQAEDRRHSGSNRCIWDSEDDYLFLCFFISIISIYYYYPRLYTTSSIVLTSSTSPNSAPLLPVGQQKAWQQNLTIIHGCGLICTAYTAGPGLIPPYAVAKMALDLRLAYDLVGWRRGTPYWAFPQGPPPFLRALILPAGPLTQQEQFLWCCTKAWHMEIVSSDMMMEQEEGASGRGSVEESNGLEQ